MFTLFFAIFTNVILDFSKPLWTTFDNSNFFNAPQNMFAHIFKLSFQTCHARLLTCSQKKKPPSPNAYSKHLSIWSHEGKRESWRDSMSCHLPPLGADGKTVKRSINCRNSKRHLKYCHRTALCAHDKGKRANLDEWTTRNTYINRGGPPVAKIPLRIYWIPKLTQNRSYVFLVISSPRNLQNVQRHQNTPSRE